MSKKILAGILAAASILSISAVASADESTTSFKGGAQGPNYNITAPVSYGTVDVTVPTTMESVIVNPYYAAVATKLADSDTGAKNKNFIASKVYEVVNNKTDEGIEVYATTSVSKATSLVVVDADATQPAGWATATVSATDTTVVNAGKTWNMLYTYDKITAKTDKTSGATSYTGGGMSTKQGNNVAIWAVGKAGTKSTASALGTTGTDVCLDLRVDGTTGELPKIEDKATGVNVVAFHAKGTNTGSLGKANANESVFYTIVGQLSDKAPAAAADYAWGKENLSLNVALKIVPVDVADLT